MSLQDRVESLRNKHAALDLAIAAENKRLSPNDDMIADMKRQKLRIKDELTRLSSSH